MLLFGGVLDLGVDTISLQLLSGRVHALADVIEATLLLEVENPSVVNDV